MCSWSRSAGISRCCRLFWALVKRDLIPSQDTLLVPKAVLHQKPSFPMCCHANLCWTTPQKVKVTPDEGAHDRSARMWWAGHLIFYPENGRSRANRKPAVATPCFRGQRGDITHEHLKTLISRVCLDCAQSQPRHRRRGVGAFWRKRRACPPRAQTAGAPLHASEPQLACFLS